MPRILALVLIAIVALTVVSFTMHLLFSPTSGTYGNRLVASTFRFFDHSVFPWMEVMSLEGHLEGVIHSMNHLLDWLGKVSSTHYS